MDRGRTGKLHGHLLRTAKRQLSYIATGTVEQIKRSAVLHRDTVS